MAQAVVAYLVACVRHLAQQIRVPLCPSAGDEEGDTHIEGAQEFQQGRNMLLAPIHVDCEGGHPFRSRYFKHGPFGNGCRRQRGGSSLRPLRSGVGIDDEIVTVYEFAYGHDCKAPGLDLRNEDFDGLGCILPCVMEKDDLTGLQVLQDAANHEIGAHIFPIERVDRPLDRVIAQRAGGLNDLVAVLSEGRPEEDGILSRYVLEQGVVFLEVGDDLVAGHTVHVGMGVTVGTGSRGLPHGFS